MSPHSPADARPRAGAPAPAEPPGAAAPAPAPGDEGADLRTVATDARPGRPAPGPGRDLARPLAAAGLSAALACGVWLPPATGVGWGGAEASGLVVPALLAAAGTLGVLGLVRTRTFARRLGPVAAGPLTPVATALVAALSAAGGAALTEVPPGQDLSGTGAWAVTAALCGALGALVASGVPARDPGPDLALPRLTSLLALHGVALGLTLLLALAGEPGDYRGLVAPALLLPGAVLLWGAVRFGLRAASGELALLAASAALAAWTDHGAVSAPGALDLAGGSAPGAVAGLAVLVLIGLVATGVAAWADGARRTASRVRATDDLLERVFAGSSSARVLVGPGTDPVVLRANPAAASVLGADPTGRPLGLLLGLLEGPSSPATALQPLLGGRSAAWSGPARPLARPDRLLRVEARALPGGAADVELVDVTEATDAERRADLLEELAAAVLDTGTALAAVTDLEGRLLRVNAAAARLTGVAEEQLEGRAAWDTALLPGGRGPLEATLSWPNRSGVPAAFESRALSRDGRAVPVLWRCTVVHDASGEPSYAVLTGVEVTADRADAGLAAELMRAPLTNLVLRLDADGRVVAANRGAQERLGLRDEDLRGRPVLSVFDPDEVQARLAAGPSDTAAFAAFARLVDGDGSHAGSGEDWTWVAADGERFTVSTSLARTDADEAGLSDLVLVGRDVTERRRTEEALLAALDRERTSVEMLRSMDQVKDEFVATVSHELRTPITSILGFVEVLGSGAVVEPLPEQRQLLDAIARNGDRLRRLCEDLLELSGLDAARHDPRREPVDLGTLAETALASVGAQAGDRDLDVDASRLTPGITVSADPERLLRVLVNLVENAVKFTPDGGSVRLEIATEGTEGTEAVLVVADTGIGIDPAEQDRLFTRFFRSAEAYARQIPGTGLGLAISREVVEQHGGSLTVASAPGTGTTVTVRLPRA